MDEIEKLGIDNVDDTQFGVAAISELLRVLATLIDPADRTHTDTLHRPLALILFTRALEVGGSALSRLFSLVGDGDVAEKHEPDSRCHVEIMPNESEVSTSSTSDEVDSNKISEEHTNAVNIAGDSLLPRLSSLEIYEKKTGSIQENKKIAQDMKIIVIDQICRHIFQILTLQNFSSDRTPSRSSVTIISYVLRSLITLFGTLGEHTVPQHEWFINLLLDACQSGILGYNIEMRPREQLVVNQGGVLASEVRELYLEALLLLVSMDSCFFTKIYLHHDGNMDSQSNLFKELMFFWCKFSFPDITPGGSNTIWAHQSLCIDGILFFLQIVVDRRHDVKTVPLDSEYSRPIHDLLQAENNDSYYSPQAIRFRMDRKLKYSIGVDIFESSVKKGIKYFQENGFILEKLTSMDTAIFLRHMPNLSKKRIGEFIAQPANLEILQEYARLFDFTGLRIDEAMRMYLEKFRIPGESQQIDRIMDAFSTNYFSAISHESDRSITTVDDTGVLAFSIIMLNTDQHNPQVRKRMTFIDYSRNVRGLNSGVDFEAEYLRGIYDAIKGCEIIIAEEHGGEIGFNFQWRKVKSLNAQVRHFDPKTNIYDSDLVSAVWGPCLASLFYQLENSENYNSIHRVIGGIQACAILGSHFLIIEMLDFIIISLARISGLEKVVPLLSQENIVEHMTVESVGLDHMPESLKRKDAKADAWVISLGKSYRAQIAVVLMFNIVADLSNGIREGWKSVI